MDDLKKAMKEADKEMYAMRQAVEQSEVVQKHRQEIWYQELQPVIFRIMDEYFERKVSNFSQSIEDEVARETVLHREIRVGCPEVSPYSDEHIRRNATSLKDLADTTEKMIGKEK